MHRQLSADSLSTKSVHLSQFQSERTTGALPWHCPDTNTQPVPSLGSLSSKQDRHECKAGAYSQNDVQL